MGTNFIRTGWIWLLLFGIVYCAEWRDVKRHQLIDYDLESYPLQIKTDSETGSGDMVDLCVYTKNAGSVNDYGDLGYIYIKFSNPISYTAYPCTNVQHLTTAPNEKEKIWTLTKTSTNLMIDCNGVKVIDFNFRTAGCATTWSQDVAKIVFWSNGGTFDDTASDEYRRASSCDSLPDVPHLEIISGTLPVNKGTEVTVKCNAGFTLEGDDVITCNQGSEFIGSSSCQKDTCTQLPDTENLTTEVVFPVDHGVEIAVDCMAGFTLEEHNTITCVKENVFTETAYCERNTCTELPDIERLSTERTFPVDYGTPVSVKCDHDWYQLIGAISITCDKDKVFTFQAEPRCDLGIALSCKPLYKKVKRSVTLTVLLNKATTWEEVSWKIEDRTLGTCSDDCRKEDLKLLYQTEELTATGMFRYFVEIVKLGSVVICSNSLVIFDQQIQS